MLEVHVVLARIERRVGIVAIGNIVASLHGNAQRLGLAGFFGIDAGKDVDFEIGTPRGWDGTLSGAPAPAGEYGYVLIAREPTGEVNRFKGTTTLVR